MYEVIDHVFSTMPPGTSVLLRGAAGQSVYTVQQVCHVSTNHIRRVCNFLFYLFLVSPSVQIVLRSFSFLFLSANTCIEYKTLSVRYLMTVI